MVRVDPSTTTNRQAAGLAGRLTTYRRCRLTSDFAIGCLLRYVVPALTDDDRLALADGRASPRSIQAKVKAWVHDEVDFSFRSTDPLIAAAAETIARTDGLPGTPPPAFNPIGMT